ncbi:uncharacterized protein LOC122879438 isoform X2 [Siniperca chuatsi]|uniref:uncharacterized protein LOC122879438 isoform X2 n=1 Tax=Siniperca chuatsi TaxID=119488 RepID=UPI001CE1C447|nr:uncharacterized protein LOC122879438 isoform X2 [Siniperca chuatsi]
MYYEDCCSHFPTRLPNTFWKATSPHLLDAMAQFIHLSLLLATIQLPLVSVTTCLLEGHNVTCECLPPQPIAHCCRYAQNMWECVPGSGLLGVTVTVTDKSMTINNLKLEDSRKCIYFKAWCSHQNLTQANWYLYLNVTRGQHQKQKDQTTEAGCRKLCTEDPTCQYFTLHKRNNKCFLMVSTDNVVITLNKDTVSGYPLTNGCSDINGLQFHQEAKSWIDALEHCRSQNSTLVQITNQTVQEAVNSLLQNKTDRMQDGVWIGLERSIFGNIVPWLWISGSEAAYFAWNSSFPVDRLNNHCGKIIHVKESEFKGLDANCHNKLPFICQSKLLFLFKAQSGMKLLSNVVFFSLFPGLNERLCNK